MRNKIYKVLATAFAMALVVASPNTCITSHAFGFNADAGNNSEGGMDEMPDDYWSDWENEGSSDSGASDSGASREPSYEEPSYSEPSHDSSSSNESNDNSGSSDNGSSYDSSSSTASAPAAANTGNGKKAENKTVNVTGGQRFRMVTNAEYTVHQIFHCGISRVAFKVVDADGNEVAFKNYVLEKGDDNLWYDNITLAEGVSTEGLTVVAVSGDATYLYTELGVSGVKLNGELALSTIPATDAE